MTQPCLLDQVREMIRPKHMSPRTEDAYIYYIRKSILLHKTSDGAFQHPRDLGAPEIRAFLAHLATEQKIVAASTQNVALSALLFLYRQVLHIDLPYLGDIPRAQRPVHLPVVFTKDEVHAILAELRDTPHLVVSLLYGTGMRLLECLQLRVKDVDFG